MINLCPIQTAALEARVQRGDARTSDLVDVAERVGLSRIAGTAQRAVDHFITTERRAGRLQMVGGRWARKQQEAAL
jgi:hypothetical protein